jgi:hypothetical protein
MIFGMKYLTMRGAKPSFTDRLDFATTRPSHVSWDAALAMTKTREESEGLKI